MAGYVFHHDAFSDLINKPNGPVAHELRRQGEEIVHDTQEHLNVLAPPGRPINDTGVPWKRTGDLRRSVRIIDTSDQTIMFAVIADAVHHGRQYSIILREREFDLVPPRIREL